MRRGMNVKWPSLSYYRAWQRLIRMENMLTKEVAFLRREKIASASLLDGAFVRVRMTREKLELDHSGKNSIPGVPRIPSDENNAPAGILEPPTGTL